MDDWFVRFAVGVLSDPILWAIVVVWAIMDIISRFSKKKED